MYAFYKGMKLYGLTTLTVGGNPLDWESDYDTYLVSSQQAGGFWGDCCWFDQNFATYVALAILAPAVGGLPPVANADGPYGPVAPHQSVTFDGSQSFHKDPAKQIVTYQWDYNAADGLWWDTKPAPASTEGGIGQTVTFTQGYPDTGQNATYTVTLRVIDNSTPPQTDIATSTVQVTTGNVPPVAVTNGPWVSIPGVQVTFDGSKSYDPNACPPDPNKPQCTNDQIVSYEWDLNGDGIYNNPDGSDGTPVTAGNWSVVTKTYSTPVSGLATLRVTDSHGLQGTLSAQFVTIAIVFAQDYSGCWNQVLDRYSTQRGLNVTFSNKGNGQAQNVKVTLTGLPTNQSVVEAGFSNLGNIDPGVSKLTACDPSAKTADIIVKTDRRVIPTGSWSWKAEFDFNGQHYIIPNIPPLGP